MTVPSGKFLASVRSTRGRQMPRTRCYGRVSFTGDGLRGVSVGMRGSGAGGADRVPIRSALRTLAALIWARWVNACGKLPTCRRRATSYSSAYRRPHPPARRNPARGGQRPRNRTQLGSVNESLRRGRDQPPACDQVAARLPAGCVTLGCPPDTPVPLGPAGYADAPAAGAAVRRLAGTVRHIRHGGTRPVGGVQAVFRPVWG